MWLYAFVFQLHQLHIQDVNSSALRIDYFINHISYFHFRKFYSFFTHLCNTIWKFYMYILAHISSFTALYCCFKKTNNWTVNCRYNAFLSAPWFFINIRNLIPSIVLDKLMKYINTLYINKTNLSFAWFSFK